MSEKPRLGKLSRMYNFILNPHAGTRVSRCPRCEAKMHQRKVPLFIHVDPRNPVVIGYTCRYCPDCDLLVAHQDEVERLLANLFAARDPPLSSDDYMVMGTVERKAWRASLVEPMSIPDMLEQLHDFKKVWSLEFRPRGWYTDEQIEADERARAQAREEFEAREQFAAREPSAARVGGAGRTQEPPRPQQPAKRRRKRRDKRKRKRL